MTTGSRQGGRGTSLLAVAVLTLAGLWGLFTTSTSGQERLLGAGSILLSALFLSSVYREELQRYDLRLADVLSLWRTPWYIVSSLWEIVAVLFRDLSGIEAAPSLYRVCGFQTAKEDPRLVTRRALATAYTSLAPNFIVIGIDYTQSRMLFHQIRSSTIPKMTMQLGAQITSDPTRHALVKGQERP
jgi:hypothetical protein